MARRSAKREGGSSGVVDQICRGLAATVAACALIFFVGGCRPGSTDRGNSPPDPKNQLPFGILETPRPNAIVGRMVDVTGWALDDSAVTIVHLYVDGRYQTSAPLKEARPDVATDHPRFASAEARHGWHALVDLGERPGAHEIVAQAVDDQGATRDIGAIVVNLIVR